MRKMTLIGISAGTVLVGFALLRLYEGYQNETRASLAFAVVAEAGAKTTQAAGDAMLASLKVTDKMMQDSIAANPGDKEWAALVSGKGEFNPSDSLARISHHARMLLGGSQKGEALAPPKSRPPSSLRPMPGAA